MSKFNTKSAPSKTINLAGAVAFKLDKATELTHAVLASFLEDKYYESGDKRLTRINKLVEATDPEYVARLAVVARTEFHMRSVVAALLGSLSKYHKGDDLVKRAIVKSATRVDDLTELAALVGSPMPKQVKRGIRNAILKFNRYQLGKYRAEGSAVSLVDLFNLTHPKTKHATKEQKAAWKDLINGKLTAEDTWETELSNAKDDKARKTALESLVRGEKMGYMALLRNLNNFVKYGVNETAIKRICGQLTDPDRVAKSKQLPFRFITAYNNVKGNRQFSDAISEAMDLAVSNVPELSGKTLIAVDSSGSMDGDPIEKACIFCATLMKANKNADVVFFSNTMKEISMSGRAPVVDLTEALRKQHMGGGTDTALVFNYALAKKKNYSRIIILSDNESWMSEAQRAYKNYVMASKENPFIYPIDLQGYSTADVKGNRVFHLTGWSDRVLDFIGQAEKGDTLIDYVKNYEL